MPTGSPSPAGPISRPPAPRAPPCRRSRQPPPCLLVPPRHGVAGERDAGEGHLTGDDIDCEPPAAAPPAPPAPPTPPGPPAPPFAPPPPPRLTYPPSPPLPPVAPFAKERGRVHADRAIRQVDGPSQSRPAPRPARLPDPDDGHRHAVQPAGPPRLIGPGHPGALRLLAAMIVGRLQGGQCPPPPASTRGHRPADDRLHRMNRLRSSSFVARRAAAAPASHRPRRASRRGPRRRS